MNFDQYYTIPVNVKSHTPFHSQHRKNEGAIKNSLTENMDSTLSPRTEKYMQNVTPKLTHFNRCWNPGTRKWTLWTLRDQNLSDLKNIRSNKLNIQSSFFDVIFKSGYSASSEFPKIPTTARVFEVTTQRLYPSNDLFMNGECSTYSYASDIVRIRVEDVAFAGISRLKNVDHLLAAGCLAHILTPCVNPHEIFIVIGGRDVRSDGKEMPLNLFTEDEEEESEDIIIIRLCFNFKMPNVSFIEKITPDRVRSDPDGFVFKYAIKDKITSYSRDILRLRKFSLVHGHDIGDFFHMPLTREGNIAIACRKLLQGQIEWRRLTQQEDSGFSSTSPASTSTSSTSSNNTPSPVLQNIVQPNRFEATKPRTRRATFTKEKHSEIYRYSADVEEDCNLNRTSSSSFTKQQEKPNRNNNHWIHQIPLLKTFFVIIFPLVILGFCAWKFNPDQSSCSCNGEEESESMESFLDHPWDY